MRRGLRESIALHVVVLLLVIFGLPHFNDDVVMTAAPIPVDIVSPDQVASAPQKAHHASAPAKPTPPKPEPPKPVTPPPPPPPAPAPPPPPPEPTPQPDAVPPPPDKQQPKPPEVKPQPPKPTPPKPTPPKPAPDKPAKPEKPAQQAQKPTKPAKPNKQFSSLLDDLSTEDDEQPPREGAKDSPVEDSPNLSTMLNASEMDAVRQQVMGCWLQPTGLKEDQSYVVEIKVEINEDRTVRSAKVVDTARMRSDPFYRSLGESAVRAFYAQSCSPLLLPEGKYSTWHSVTFRFSPGGIL